MARLNKYFISTGTAGAGSRGGNIRGVASDGVNLILLAPGAVFSASRLQPLTPEAVKPAPVCRNGRGFSWNAKDPVCVRVRGCLLALHVRAKRLVGTLGVLDFRAMCLDTFFFNTF